MIAPGTGLGQAGLFWDGTQHQVFACEGGHADFAPQGELQIELLRFLANRYGHVSYERVLSGPGLVNVYQFLHEENCEDEPAGFSALMERETPLPRSLGAHSMEAIGSQNGHSISGFRSMAPKQAILL